MFFKDYFTSVADCFDAKIKGYKQQTHSGDKGELCELFIKGFLDDAFSGMLRIFRGGHIIDSENKKSEQIDIVLCCQNSLKIFSDKGLYPIETVYGAVSVKKELTHTNLFSENPSDCGAIKNLRSIPKDNVKLNIGFHGGAFDNFQKRFPCKIVFAYEGTIQHSWSEELNNLVQQYPEQLNILPDYIIVNKKGMIAKQIEGKGVLNTGETIETHFHYSSFDKNEKYYAPFLSVCYCLYNNALWQYYIGPKYEEYFNKDI